ncbi:hypothetical protein PsYK624_101500 [Phanerochaete sordida]|uniref:AB hydrolase-1 domain-containing protein n=1 Tax=Phanerochaete sordida TaxID=48140 RepID=A0A9P3GFJ1_9APHY|nr:hypothetical protein PsYK624_101500 [Phanerochaete sordida]
MLALGKLAYRDTGAVTGSEDYTTVAIVHGFGWSNGVFRKLEPLAAQYNARLVLINRRDFPGSDPYDDDERAELERMANDPPGAQEIIQRFMTRRARELYDFLVKFISQEDIPAANGAAGGLVLVGWSFGSTFITAFLQALAALPTNDVELRAYMRRVVLYDPPCHSLGIALPADHYHPLEDDAIPPLERPMAFSRWVTGYYTHGDSPAALERRTPVAEPRPTILNFAPEELAQVFHQGPTGPGGSDLALLRAGIASGLNAKMKDEGFYPAADDEWHDVEIRYLWCDRSVYEMPWGTWALRKELEEARAAGRRTRNLTVVCLPGANHFAHWDDPERLLKALLAEQGETAGL